MLGGDRGGVHQGVTPPPLGLACLKVKAYFSTSHEQSLQGTHGYDFRYSSMHALFLAHGPSFKRIYKGVPFENIEIYNLLAGDLHANNHFRSATDASIVYFTDLLNIPKDNRAPNNGTQGSLRDLLLDPFPLPTKPFEPMQVCGQDMSSLVGCSCGTQVDINNI